MEVKPIAWSHSRIKDLKQCPKLCQHKNVIKDIPFETSAAMEQGKLVHKMFEDRVSVAKPFPHGYEKYESVALPIIRAPGQTFTELQMTLTQAMTPTGWFAKDAWCRVQVDVMKINGTFGWAGDYKTGKVDFDESQLELTAAVMMTLYQELEQVTTTFIWLRDGITNGNTYTRAQLPVLWSKLLVEPTRMQEYNTTNQWPARPSYKCAYCPVNKLGKCQQAGAPYKGN